MTYQEVVAAISELTRDERRSLLLFLARSVRDEDNPGQRTGSSLDRILGIGKPDGPPPTDDEAADAYVEYLLRKYA
jgi:hypothetical protein